MPPKVNVIKNIGDIKQTVDYPQSLRSDFMGTLESIFLLGVKSFLGPFGFIIDVIFFQSDNSTVNFSVEVNGSGFTADSNGEPVDGTIDNIVMSFEGEQTAEITGLSTDFSDFLANGTPFSTADFIDNLAPGQKVSFQGGNGDDTHTGTKRGDNIKLGGGNDVVDGRGGRDNIKGGAGRDFIEGGAGNDILIGGKGRDNILGGNGKDLIKGGSGADNLAGGNGDDKVEGGKGRDFLFGDSGDDQLFGGGGGDTLDGGSGSNFLTGGAGAETFQFFDDGGENVVTDFDRGVDQIEIGNPGISSFQDVLDNAQNLSGDVIITLDGEGGFIRLEGVTKNQLSDSDFIF